MHLSLRWRLAFAFLAISALTLAAVALLDAWFAARRTRYSVEQQLNQLVDALSQGVYRLDGPILAQIEGLTGARLVLRSASGNTLAASDPQFDAAARAVPPTRRVTLDRTVTVQQRPYFHAAVELKRAASGFERQTLHIFYSADDYYTARRDAMTPPLLVSLALFPLTTLLAVALAQQIATPIARLRAQVARISGGDYAVGLVESRTREVRELSQSIQQMAGMLAAYTEETRKAERLKALAQVNASLVHQLRNALAGCLLSVDLHRRKCNQADQSLDIAVRQLQQMGDYISRFVQIDAARPAPREEAELVELLRGVLEVARPAADHLGVQLETDLSDEPLRLQGDPQTLRQVMTNLVNNALEAAASQPSPGEAPRVVVRLQKTPQGARLEVGDTGPGVPDEIAGQLYEPFATGKPEGLGLGLFVAKSAAEAHAGKIEHQRRDGWTWFLVTLPLSN